MTHFVTLICVPKTVVEDPENYIWEKMKPFIESGTGDCDREYETWTTEIEARDVEKEGKKIWEDFKNRKGELEDWEIKAQETYNALAKKKDWRAIVMEHHGYEVNDDEDLGDWNNDNSFYDWYRIGGRWDGVITDNIQESEDNGFNFDDKHEMPQNNSLPAKVLLKKAKADIKKNKIYREATEQIAKQLESDYPFSGFGWFDIFTKIVGEEDRDKIPKEKKDLYDEVDKRFAKNIREFQFDSNAIYYKVIDINGELHEGKSYGWFGLSDQTKDTDDYEKEYLKVLEEAGDGVVILLDCHV